MLSASKSGSASGASGYNLTRSLRFRASASAYLNRTPASATNRQQWTWSGWVKRGTLTSSYPTIFGAATDSNNYNALRFYDAATGYLQFSYVVGGVDTIRIATTQVFRDPSAWYHIVLAVDTTQATASNRFKLYVNGNQVTSFSYATYPAQNTNMWVNQATTHGIGYDPSIGYYYDGYLTEINFVDGQQLTPSSFGSTNALTGVWQPARYTGTYGTNGFYLNFTDNSALTTSSNVGLGKDFSGNGNYWTTNNISITAGVTYDSMTDVPTLTSATAANFPTLNQLNGFKQSSSLVLSNANLTASYDRTTFNSWVPATIAIPTTGKWYWEWIQTADTTTGLPWGACGVLNVTAPIGTQYPNNYRMIFGTNGNKISEGGSVAYGSAGVLNDIFAVAVDMSSGKIFFAKNNVWQGSADPVAGTNAAYTDIVSSGFTWAPGFYFSGDLTGTVSINFGQRPFTYTPPTGFVALNTYNLPTSTILAGNKVMDATLYTGNGSTQSIVNAAGFKPDLVWIKCRSAVVSHNLADSVRGATLGLASNGTGAEYTQNGFTSFNSNGFGLAADTSQQVNNNGSTFVGWQWQAGQGSTSSNTNGSITSTVSVNASAGFSVVTYTGTGANATVGHGLGVAPSLVIVKQRSAAGNDWQVYHSSLGQNQAIQLNATNAAGTYSNYWYNGMTSSVFGINGSYAGINASAATYVAYCWTPIAGYSAFGSYTGNGSTDGPFVYTGFQPKFVMIKRTDSTGYWHMLDSVRDPYNVTQNYLLANSSNAESTPNNLDFLSNGFKLRDSSGELNASGGTYIYMVFATNPFRNSLAR